jgi:hypothetical protein
MSQPPRAGSVRYLQQGHATTILTLSSFIIYSFLKKE